MVLDSGSIEIVRFAAGLVASADPALFSTFPAESVPDGNVQAPHHLTYGLLAALVPILIVWDNKRKDEPWIELSGVLAALFGFIYTWPLYPEAGAILTGVGVGAALVAAVVAPYTEQYEWTFNHWTRHTRIVAVLCLLIALDDWLSHAFGIWTPADWLWVEYLFPIVS